MFTAVVHKNLSAAEGYFVEHLSQNDYYATKEIRAGYWIGTGAERLRLAQGNEVSREEFYRLCENRHPLTSTQLTLRQNVDGQRRVFFDFTCSAPKSVSILGVTLQDERLVQAHEEAAKIAFGELESFAATRIRKEGRQEDRRTANLVGASFLHTSSRALDPQLHTHFTVFNGTFDEREGHWKAVQAGPMYGALRYATEVYRNELARRVQSLGYSVRRVKHGFEIEGVSSAILRRFSKRSQARDQVVRELEKKLGRTLSNTEVAYAVHRSRPRKLTGITTAEVIDRQRAQLTGDEFESLHQLTKGTRVDSPDPMAESEALLHAKEHLFERASVASEPDLLAAALAHRSGEVHLPKLKQLLRKCPDLVATVDGYSTWNILETELHLIQTVNHGQDQIDPLHPTYEPPAWLSRDQQRALRQLLTSTDRITGLRGVAGSGKSTVLQELAKAVCAADLELIFSAPTTAATEVLRQEGLPCRTLQSLLMAKQPISQRHLVVLDEAGLVGIDDMKRLFAMVDGGRVILCGDSGQHASVPRGDAFRILEEHSHLQVCQLGRIRRQRRADYRRVVQWAAQKRTSEAFHELERMGAIVELPANDVHSAASATYLTEVQAGHSTLLVAPTWNEIHALTDQLRKSLKQENRLTAEDIPFTVFDSLSWTEAQKRKDLRPGLLLCFQPSKGRPPQTAEVVTGGKAPTIRLANGAVKPLDEVCRVGSLDVGEARTIGIALGDKLLLQANYQKTLRNGELVEVKSIMGKTIVLTDGRTIPEDYRTFTHGYAVTSHAAQGKSADTVLIVATSRSGPAIHRQQFYVSISRGRDRCRVFTDDKEALRSRVGRSSSRTAAIEALNRPGHSRRRHFLRRILQWSQQVGQWLRPLLPSQRARPLTQHSYVS